MAESLRIQGSRRRAARRVFEGALIGHLRRRGATTQTEMVGHLGWFWIRLNEQEVRELLEAAYRDDLIAPTGRTKRVDGAALSEPEWKPSTLGRAVTQARSLSLGDARVKLLEVAEPAAKGAETWLKRAGTLLGAFGAVTLGLSPLLVLLGIGLLGGYLITSGLKDDANLRRAARAWPRVKICRPAVYARYVEKWRPWPPPIDIGVIIYVLALAGLIGVFGTWKIFGQHSVVTNWGFADRASGLPAGLVFALLVLVYGGIRSSDWLRYRNTRRNFRNEVNTVERLREADQSRTAHPCVWGHKCKATHPPGEPLSTPFGVLTPDALDIPHQPWTRARYALAVSCGVLVATGLTLGVIFVSSGIRDTYSDQSAALAASASLIGALVFAVLGATIVRR